MDVDGILTDGTLHISSDGTETKGFSVLDGMGISRLLRAGIAVAWISGRLSGATTVRAAELKIPHLIQGRTDKRAALENLAAQLGLAASACAYMGDDDIDAPALAWARRHARRARRRRLRHPARRRLRRGARGLRASPRGPRLASNVSR
jgi:3-deoxy-D-manno-octulosonate 8-phosphate phosphatase (KDO 8-P phosphatase)